MGKCKCGCVKSQRRGLLSPTPLNVTMPLAGDMEERGVGENAIEVISREIECEKVLLPHFATRFARHCGETRGTFQADGGMTKVDKRLEVASRPTAKVENGEGRLSLDVLQESRNVLADIVPQRSVPETLGSFVIVLQRLGSDGA